jgi:hypothetical protein
VFYMRSRAQRPTAFEISFPEEAAAAALEAQEAERQQVAQAAKRKNLNDGALPNPVSLMGFEPSLRGSSRPSLTGSCT